MIIPNHVIAMVPKQVKLDNSQTHVRFYPAKSHRMLTEYCQCNSSVIHDAVGGIGIS